MYRTTDLNVAAFLLARGHSLTEIEALTDGRRGTFVFLSGADDADLYFRGEMVNAKKFATAFKQLKSAIHRF